MHTDPKAWTWLRGKDGQVRAWCPLCDKFMGFVQKDGDDGKEGGQGSGSQKDRR
jgi:hypothetical protein